MPSYQSKPAPRCPLCGWHLAFELRSKHWVAICWNNDSERGCPVDIVPGRFNYELFDYISSRSGWVGVYEVCCVFDWTAQNANNYLAEMMKLGFLVRRRIPATAAGVGWGYQYKRG